MIESMGRILAIDYGRKRTGLAVSDPLRLIATPLETVPTHQLMDYLTQYLQRETVDTVVIGEPHKTNNEESETMQYIRPFLNGFRKRFPQLEVVMYDERFTSVLAHRAMIDGGMKRKQRQDKAVVDKLAACIILEDYMSRAV